MIMSVSITDCKNIMLLHKCIPCLKSRVDEDITILDFSNAALTEIFPNVWRYERTLEELYLTSTRINTLPPQLFYCQNLHVLVVNGNNLKILPNAIGSLRQLYHLNISRNFISNVPDSIKLCKNLTHLDLSCNNIQRLPEALTYLISLQELFLNETYLEFLPANFGRLINLRILELRLNNLVSLPKSMIRLCNLRRIDIGANEFIELPDVIGELNKLQELWIDFNQIRQISANVMNLSELQHFEADGNLINMLPNDISNWHNIEVLSLSKNNFKCLPSYVGVLRNIVTLKCQSCNLSELPSSIANLENLEELVISYNQLKKLPNTIGILRKLRFLFVDGNNLITLPNEICSCSGLSVLSVSRNRLIELPQQIGHLIQLKVLNLVHNCIEFLPISVLSLINLKSMWISDNQSKPLVPLQYVNIHTKLHLTCFMLPQKSPPPFRDTVQLKKINISKGANPNKIDNHHMIRNCDDFDLLYENHYTRPMLQSSQTYTNIESNNSNKRICFAEKATILAPHSPVQDLNTSKATINLCLSNEISFNNIKHKQSLDIRLMRSPTPYPKQLRLMSKNVRSEQKMCSQSQQRRLHHIISSETPRSTINLNNEKNIINISNNITNYKLEIVNSFNKTIIRPKTSITKPFNVISGTIEYTTATSQNTNSETFLNQFITEDIYACNIARLHRQSNQLNFCLQTKSHCQTLKDLKKKQFCDYTYYMKFLNSKRPESHPLVISVKCTDSPNNDALEQICNQSPFIRNKNFCTLPVSTAIIFHKQQEEITELALCQIRNTFAKKTEKIQNKLDKQQTLNSQKYLKIPKHKDNISIEDLIGNPNDSLDVTIKITSALYYQNNTFSKLNEFQNINQDLKQNQREHVSDINEFMPNLSICRTHNALSEENNILYMKYYNKCQSNISSSVKSYVKNTPWLFGVHKNPTVKQITLKWDQQIGFDINDLPNNEGICIASIVPQSPAAHLLCVHDKLLEIDGYDCTNMNLRDANDILSQVGPVVQIMLSRK